MTLLKSNCNRQWGGSVCGSWGKGSHFGDGGPGPPEMEKGQQLAPDSGGEAT
jgi:hypothetical protein